MHTTAAYNSETDGPIDPEHYGSKAGLLLELHTTVPLSKSSGAVESWSTFDTQSCPRTSLIMWYELSTIFPFSQNNMVIITRRRHVTMRAMHKGRMLTIDDAARAHISAGRIHSSLRLIDFL